MCDFHHHHVPKAHNKHQQDLDPSCKLQEHRHADKRHHTRHKHVMRHAAFKMVV